MTKHERLKQNIENLDCDEIVALWNDYCEKGNGDESYTISDDQEFFWDNAGDSAYNLMKIAADGDVDLEADYVMMHPSGEYETFNASDVLDYVNVDDIVDWLMEYDEKVIMREYGILPTITKEDICDVICKCISGLTHAIEDAQQNNITSVKGNVNQQIERLTQLQKDIKEMMDSEED